MPIRKILTISSETKYEVKEQLSEKSVIDLLYMGIKGNVGAATRILMH